MLDSGIQGIGNRDGVDPTTLLLDQLDEEETPHSQSAKSKSDKWKETNIDNRDFDTMTNPDIQSMAQKKEADDLESK